MPFGAEARHHEVMVALDPPTGRQPRPFSRIATALHGEHAGIGAAERRHLRDQVRQRREGARHHGIEGCGRNPLAGARLQRLDIAETERACGVRHEAHLLAVGVEQREPPLRLRDGERQPGEARAGADIGDARAVQMRRHGQAVEQMVRDHLVARGHGREVVGPVPARELVQQTRERRRLRGVEHDTEPGRAVDDALRFVHAVCALRRALRRRSRS